MSRNAADTKIREQKDLISQLNMTINSQNELIASLRSTLEECNSTIAGLRGQVEYLTGNLFGTSSEKTKRMEGQLSLFDEAEQEAHPAGEITDDEPVRRPVVLRGLRFRNGSYWKRICPP